MQNVLVRKSLVIGMIILFVGVGVLSSVSSKDVSVSDEEMVENDTTSEDNNNIAQWDEYKEIIAYIDGFGHVSDYGGFLIKHFRFRDGEFYIRAITTNPLKRIYIIAHEIDVPFFIGRFDGYPWDEAGVYGFAIGNFNWR